MWCFNHTVRSRRDSDASNSSVNTLEDLSLAFKLTIAMGEEALDNDSEDERDDDNFQQIPNESVDYIQDTHNNPNEDIVQDIPNEIHNSLQGIQM